MNSEENVNQKNLVLEVVKTPTEQLDDFVKEKGLVLDSAFVPHSFSRNSKQKYKSINWKVYLKSNKSSMSTDYSYGVGHLKYPDLTYSSTVTSYDKRMIVEAENHAAETGKKRVLRKNGSSFQVSNFLEKNVEKPTMKAILESLVVDSNVIDYLTYESWAEEFGYSKDSREGEKVYNACKEITQDFLNTIGGRSSLDKLSQIIQDIDNEPAPKKNKP